MQISEPAEYIILGLLKKHPMHGYEMFQQMGNSVLSQILHVEMSQMYAYLKKLEKMEYIETRLEAQGARPPRKVHHLTPQGEKSFMHWLVTPVEKPRDIRILFLIKLYFVRSMLPNGMEQLIAQQIVACQHFLRHMESLQASHLPHRQQENTSPNTSSSTTSDTTSDNDDDIFFSHIVLRSRIHQTCALLDWLQEVQA